MSQAKGSWMTVAVLAGVLAFSSGAQLQRQGYYKAFPPDGVEVVSWYVMMGIGQVVTLRLPASRLREVNRILENTAWGSYRTEFYPTYDYKATGIAAHEKAQ